MKLDLQLVPRLEQKLKLAPQIIQSVEILQLPILALENRINQELAENPVLEVQDASQEASAETPAEVTPDASSDEFDFQRLDELDEEWQDYFYPYGRQSSADDEDPKFEAMQNTADRPASLQEHLLAQYRLTDSPAELSGIAEYIICNIDDNGYLRYPLEELVGSFDGEATGEQAEEALKVIQSLDPPGVGARSLKECLLLQLDPDDARYALERELVSFYLDQLLANKFPLVARRSGHSLGEIKQAVTFIGALNPRPGALFKNETVMYVSPEIVVEETDAGYQVRLEDERIPHLYISSFYRRLLSDLDTPVKTRDYLKRKMQAARWLIDAVAQRRRTIYGVSKAIVDMQQDFFKQGLASLRPLRMQDVADRVGVHVSTVSRAISDKYIQTPSGAYALKYFFTGGTRTENGELASWKSVKQKLAELVSQEDKSKPLSDGAIVRALKAQGINLARRTVTKYRAELGIPSSRLRRQY